MKGWFGRFRKGAWGLALVSACVFDSSAERGRVGDFPDDEIEGEPVGLDRDRDTVPDDDDNCPFVPNPLQEDSDQNGVGDACS